MKKINFSDLINEVSIVAFCLSVFASVLTFSISIPAFIASVAVASTGLGGIIGTAVYNKKQIKKKYEAVELEKENEDKQVVETIEKLRTEENQKVKVNETVLNTKKETTQNKKIK